MGVGVGFGVDGLIDISVSGETCFAVGVEVGTVVGAEKWQSRRHRILHSCRRFDIG